MTMTPHEVKKNASISVGVKLIFHSAAVVTDRKDQTRTSHEFTIQLSVMSKKLSGTESTLGVL